MKLIRSPATKQRIPLPEGYKIYAHRKKQPDGSLRTDYYVFVCMSLELCAEYELTNNMTVGLIKCSQSGFRSILWSYLECG